MKRLLIIFILLIPIAFGLSNPMSYNGKTYYMVTSTDPTEDTGTEVCAKAGLSCVGYTEESNAVCKMFHPNAAETSSLSGDKAGVYCDGSPQIGVCSTLTHSCHTCPACTATVTCDQVIGGLYREMFVECAANPSCTISISARNVNDFMNQIPVLNTQLTNCPQTLPKGTGLVLSNGLTLVNIAMNNGQTQSFTLKITNGQLTGISAGGSLCVQKITVSENDFNSVLSSSNMVQAISYLVAQKKVNIQGCNFLSSARLFFVKPIVRIVAGNQGQSMPAAKPKDCGKIGEQCNNRGCESGMCAAPKENINGQWRFVNYRCINQRDWDNYCTAHGNTPAAWHCIAYPC